MRKLIFLFVLIPSLSFAQLPIDSYEIRFYQGGTLPITTHPFPFSDIVCNQPLPVIPPTVVNPTMIAWDDDDNVGMVCVYDLTTAINPILGIPIGTYTSRLVAINLTATSSESLDSNPFLRQNPPSVLTGVLVFQ